MNGNLDNPEDTPPLFGQKPIAATGTGPRLEPNLAPPGSRGQAVGRSRYFPVMTTILLVLLSMLVIPPFLERVSYHSARGRVRAAREGLQESEILPFAETSRRVSEAAEFSVVYINTQASLPAGRLIPGTDGATVGQGSGVIIDDAGHVLTNFHVIAGAQRVVVYLHDGRAVSADLVGADEYTDLAVLKIPPEGLIPIPWGDSDTLQTGDPVWAVGSPYGLENSVSFGIVSASGRQGVGATRYQDFLQTDAAVNPGNSGGALVNQHGQLIGINTAILGNTFRGISFAIPSKMARDVFQRLKDDGQYARGWLGVQLDKISAEQAEQLGMPDTNGAVVMAVVADSPADRADVRAGDVILRWNNNEVRDPSRLSILVAETDPDSTVEMIVLRDGKPLKLMVRVGRLLPQMLSRR